MPTATPLLEVNNLVKYFPVQRGAFSRRQGLNKAVDGVSFTLYPGETLAVVGESGCGKTTLAQTILRLLPADSGSVRLNGEEILKLQGATLKRARRNMQVVFQDPASSLNPRLKIGTVVGEPLRTHEKMSGTARRARVEELLALVGLDAAMLHRYPHQFSGGQRQRIGIARAIALQPQLIICDEPVSALDLSVRAQVLNLLLDLQERYRLAYLFISHDLSVVRYLAHRILVMYLGKAVEMAPTERLFATPLHPYTQALLSVIPQADPKKRGRRKVLLSGDPPSSINPTNGCRFASRCPLAEARCFKEEPAFCSPVPEHQVACWKATGGSEGNG